MGKGTAVLIVGAGGIGSALFQDLCRFLRHDIDIHLMDGDQVEGKNIQRQMFSKRHLGLNKAKSLVETATSALGRNGIRYHDYYLTDVGQLQRITGHYDVVTLVGAVDNHPARRVMEQFVKGSPQPIYYVDCANEETRGEVVAVHGGQDGARGGYYRSEYDPAVLTDDTGDPTKASCTQQLDAGNIQTLYTNRKAAILAVELIAAYLRGEVLTGIVYFRECTTPRLKGVAPGGSPEVVLPGGEAAVT